MARFERSRDRGSSRDSGEGYSRRDSGDRGGFGGGRDSGRGSRFGGNFRGGSRGGRDSGRGGFGRDRPIEKTVVTCSSCGEKCEVPFKPTSSKPVYCDACFKDKGKGGGSSSKDIEMINEKLNKIMKALDIQ